MWMYSRSYMSGGTQEKFALDHCSCFSVFIDLASCCHWVAALNLDYCLPSELSTAFI